VGGFDGRPRRVPPTGGVLGDHDTLAQAMAAESGRTRPMPESVTGPRDTIPRDEVQPPS